jgi:hypothetical protein
MRPLCRTVLLCALLALMADPLRPVRAGADPLPSTDPILQQAIETARAVTPPSLRAKTFINVAQICLSAGRPEQARQALAYARDAALTPMGLAAASPTEVGQACAKLGFPADARDLAARLPLSGDRLDLTIAAADAYAAAGSRTQAAATLRALLDAYTPSLDPALAAEALSAAAARGEPAAGRPLLKQAEQLAASMAPRDRDEVLAGISDAYGRLGDDDDALRAALQIEAPIAQASAVAATALQLAPRDEAAAVARVRQAARGARRADLRMLSEAFGKAAAQASDAGFRNVTRALLDAAEQAGARAGGTIRQAALRDTAGLYGTRLDDWPQALKVAEESGDDFTIRTARAQVLIQLAAQGKAEQAGPLFQTVAADSVSYIGQNLLQGVAGAFLQLHPQAGIEQAMAVQPPELSDHVLAAGARKALADGDPATAIDWALGIASDAVSQEVLVQSALARVQMADAAGLTKAEADARRVAARLRSDFKQRDILLTIAERHMALGDTASAQRLVAECDATHPLEREDVGALVRLGAMEQKLGHPDRARERLAKAFGVVKNINCAGCEHNALTEMLKDLLAHADIPFLSQALGQDQQWDLPARQVLDMLDALPELPAERRHLALRIALQDAAADTTRSVGSEQLARTAAAYRRAGITPDGRDLALLPTPPAPAMDAQMPAAVGRQDQPAVLVYFETRGCAECRDVSEMLDRILAKTHNVKVTRYVLDARDPRQKDVVLLNEALATALHVPERKHQKAPAIFSSKRAIVSRDITEQSLLGLIQEARGEPGPEQRYALDLQKAESRLSHRYSSLALLVVIGNGLLDGVNPCAFTVIIFFLSYLAFLGHNRREILAAGVFFTAANFLTYLAIGIFLAGLIQFSEARSAAFARALYGVTAVLVLVAAVLSLRDAVRCLQGRPKEMTLVLPQKLQSAIRRHITSRARFGLTAGAMAVLGSLVALISFPCTGQMYYPTIVFSLHNLPQFRWGALGWLLIYNLCFILPLVAVFLLVFFGVTSERITAVFRRHLAATKFAMAGLFAVLFGYMLTQVL